MSTRGEDFIEDLLISSTHSYVLIYTNLGRVYWVKVYNIPDAGSAARGRHIASLISLQPGETVQAFLPVREFEEGKYIVMATRQGVIKKCSLTEFSHPMSRGIIAINLDKGDELIAARLTDGNSQIVIATHHGQAIRFEETKVRAMGRPARGVRAIRLADGDEVIGMVAVTEGMLILSVTENGFGKRTPLEKYRLTARGGKGVINIKTTKRNGNVVSIMTVGQDNELMIITRHGKLIRLGADKIRATGRAAQGVRLLHMEDGDQIAAACLVPEPPNGANGKEEDGQGTLLQ